MSDEARDHLDYPRVGECENYDNLSEISGFQPSNFLYKIDELHIKLDDAENNIKKLTRRVDYLLKENEIKDHQIDLSQAELMQSFEKIRNIECEVAKINGEKNLLQKENSKLKARSNAIHALLKENLHMLEMHIQKLEQYEIAIQKLKFSETNLSFEFNFSQKSNRKNSSQTDIDLMWQIIHEKQQIIHNTVFTKLINFINEDPDYLQIKNKNQMCEDVEKQKNKNKNTEFELLKLIKQHEEIMANKNLAISNLESNVATLTREKSNLVEEYEDVLTKLREQNSVLQSNLSFHQSLLNEESQMRGSFTAESPEKKNDQNQKFDYADNFILITDSNENQVEDFSAADAPANIEKERTKALENFFDSENDQNSQLQTLFNSIIDSVQKVSKIFVSNITGLDNTPENQQQLKEESGDSKLISFINNHLEVLQEKINSIKKDYQLKNQSVFHEVQNSEISQDKTTDTFFHDFTKTVTIVWSPSRWYDENVNKSFVKNSEKKLQNGELSSSSLTPCQSSNYKTIFEKIIIEDASTNKKQDYEGLAEQNLIDLFELFKKNFSMNSNQIQLVSKMENMIFYILVCYYSFIQNLINKLDLSLEALNFAKTSINDPSIPSASTNAPSSHEIQKNFQNNFLHNFSSTWDITEENDFISGLKEIINHLINCQNEMSCIKQENSKIKSAFEGNLNSEMYLDALNRYESVIKHFDEAMLEVQRLRKENIEQNAIILKLSNDIKYFEIIDNKINDLYNQHNEGIEFDEMDEGERVHQLTTEISLKDEQIEKLMRLLKQTHMFIHTQKEQYHNEKAAIASYNKNFEDKKKCEIF